MTYELYVPHTSQGIGALSVPTMSISPSGTSVRLNGAAMDALGVGYDDTIALLVDRERGRIAIRPSQPSDRYRASLRPAPEQRTRVGILSIGEGIFKRNQIDTHAAHGSYPLRWDETVTPRVLWLQLPEGSWRRPGIATTPAPARKPDNGKPTPRATPVDVDKHPHAVSNGPSPATVEAGLSASEARRILREAGERRRAREQNGATA